VVTHQLQVERETGKVRRSKTGVLLLCYAANTDATNYSLILTLTITLTLKPIFQLLHKIFGVVANPQAEVNIMQDFNDATMCIICKSLSSTGRRVNWSHRHRPVTV